MCRSHPIVPLILGPTRIYRINSRDPLFIPKPKSIWFCDDTDVILGVPQDNPEFTAIKPLLGDRQPRTFAHVYFRERMKIITTATAFPPHYFLQEEVVEALKTQWEDGLENAAVLERLHSRTGVAGRYFSLPLEQYPPLDTWGKTNNVWIETAERLGEQAIDCVLNKAGVDRKQIGALYFVSVTGVSSPSVDARLVNRMRLSPQIKRNPIFGLGCVAGAAGLARAADYVRAYPDQVAVLLSVELCSLTWQRDDFTVANLIATGLFGDGAVAVLVAGDQVEA